MAKKTTAATKTAASAEGMEQYFKLYPNITVFFRTADGTVFLDANPAKNHATHIGGDVAIINRPLKDEQDATATA
jgi:hypothetical protein